MSDFQQCVILTSVDLDEPVQPPFMIRAANGVQSVAKQSKNIQATNEGSGQTTRRRRLI